MHPLMHTLSRRCTSLVTFAVALSILVGCSKESEKKPAPTPPPPTNPSPMAKTPDTTPPAMPPATQPAFDKSQLEVRAIPRDPNTGQPADASESLPPIQAGDEERRQQAQDLIYATIRMKMEEFIAERGKLLKSGFNPADEKVRELEGRIMRARDLLIEAGEVVEEVDPPIVTSAPAGG